MTSGSVTKSLMELFVTRASHIGHQDASGNIYLELKIWPKKTNLGKPILTPGIIFSDTDNVIPDLVWVSNESLSQIVDDEGHLTSAPELVIEVLSEGSNSERRDREVKLKLFSVKGVQEYWIVNWRSQQVEIFRRQDAILIQIATLFTSDAISSPLLPGFSCSVAKFFA